MRNRSVLAVLVPAVAAALLLGTGAATAAAVPQAAAATSVTPPPYANPMRLTLKDGGQAASCADPFVLHGATAGDTSWYLYCTSDALSASEKDGSGALVQHQVPMYRSTDLTSWTYVGDAFPTKPSYLKADAGVWAPDVVYRNGHYLLYYTASDTNLPGGGSAIGVATSPSPTGPWTDSGSPVVAPQNAPGSSDKRWTFDPEVITAGATSYLYFGSYFGGIHVRTLSADGRSSDPASEQQIAIDNRYEGTFIEQHAGWYYLMASASNCCNGPLTGYSVFAARSRSPLGPFLDRDGRSILSTRVGGTPVLAQNGNRWVGAGHNAVVTDFAGQDWIVYHAVDRTDPYYAGNVGYTKRPALIDPLDWQDGWPVVRGGAGPSDSTMPGPVAQPGETPAYTPTFVAQDRPGTVVPGLSDEFTGTALAKRWTWVRRPSASTYGVTNGAFTWQTQAADLQPQNPGPLASVLTEPAPTGDYVVDTRVRVSTPDDGSVHNYVQGGLIVYRDDGHSVRLTSNNIFNTRQTEFGVHDSSQPAGYPVYGNGVVGPVGDWTYLRVVHRGTRYTAYTSLDGTTWDRGDTWTQDLGSQARIGLISLGGSGFTASFDYVRVSHLAR